MKNKVLKTDLGILKNFELSIGKIIEETWEEEAGPTLFTPWKFFYINEVISSEDSIIFVFLYVFFHVDASLLNKAVLIYGNLKGYFFKFIQPFCEYNLTSHLVPYLYI